MLLAGVEVDVTKIPFNVKAGALEKARKCHQYALFFNKMSPGWILIAPLFAIMSAVLTAYIRSITPGIGDKAPPQPASSDVEATVIPEIMAASTSTPTDSEVHPQVGDEPPPYQPPAIEIACGHVIAVLGLLTAAK